MNLHLLALLATSKRAVSPLDMFNKYRSMTDIPDFHFDLNEWILASLIHDANMTARTNMMNNNNLNKYACEEKTLDNLLPGDATFLSNFNFERQLFSFVTCAGQTIESDSLGMIFTPLHWNVWVLIVFGALLLLVILTWRSGIWDLGMMMRTNISLILASLGCEVGIRRELVTKNILACLLVFWSLIGIIIGNLYLARLTESLISPIKYDPNITFAKILDEKFKILLIQDKKIHAPSAARNLLWSLPGFRLLSCQSSQFCHIFIRNYFINNEESSEQAINCKNEVLGCNQLTTNISLVGKVLDLIMYPKNYRVLIRHLSSCDENAVFIHNRVDMREFVKPKLPKFSLKYRREFQHSHNSDLIFPRKIIYATTEDVEYLISPMLKKYFQHGLYHCWANVASLLMFRWNTGTNEHTDENANTIVLDAKFLRIIFVTLSAYGFSMVVLVCEWIIYYRNSTNLKKSGIFRLFLRIERMASILVENLMLKFT